jgi:hypothetical protein
MRAMPVSILNVYRGEGSTAEYLAINPSGQSCTEVDCLWTQNIDEQHQYIDVSD